MELQGTVKTIFDTQTFASGFQKKELILLTEEQYPQPISIDFLSDKISLLDNVFVGESIKVGINIRGREWTSPQGEVKYFNSINGWRLEKVGGTQQSNNSTSTQQNPNTSSQDPFGNDEYDDLPF